MERLLERLFVIRVIGNCRRADRIPTRQFHSPSPDCRTTDACAAVERLLEDVLDRHPTGSDLLVLPIYFRKPYRQTHLSLFPEGEKRRSANYLTHPLSLVMIAFVVTAIPSFLLTKVIGKNLESLLCNGCIPLLIGGIVMWVIDAIKALVGKAVGRGLAGSPIPHLENGTTFIGGQAIWIGACQILSAVFPGTSRSMSTIAAGQLFGMSRCGRP